MIYELSFDAAKPADAHKIVEIVRDVRVGRHAEGKLHGCWTSEFGAVNNVVQLWAHEDLGAWAAATGALAASKAYQRDYVQAIEPFVVTQERRLMRAQKPFRLDLGPTHFYELRMYDLEPGGIPKFVAPMLDILPFRDRFSPNVGLWQPLTGDTNQLIHMWAYRDLQQRAEVRGTLASLPEWQAYVAVIFPFIRRMTVHMLFPTPFSPAQ